MKKTTFLWLAFATLIGLGGIGFILIPVARDISFLDFLRGHKPILFQLITGLLSGLLIAVLAHQLINIPYLQSTKDFFKKLIGGLRLDNVEIIFISICAGVGEELLFRGAIQPFAGIFITSIVFVAIHGYLNPKNPKLFIYGAFMTISIIYIGYLTEKIGILASVIAHTAIDIYLLKKFS